MFTRLQYIHEMFILRKSINNMKTIWRDLYDETDVKGEEERYEEMKENFKKGVYKEI